MDEAVQQSSVVCLGNKFCQVQNTSDQCLFFGVSFPMEISLMLLLYLMVGDLLEAKSGRAAKETFTLFQNGRHFSSLRSNKP